jgi:hypothetical protein
MAYEPKPGDVSIFKNERRDHEKYPHWRGEVILPSGETLEIVLWEKQGRKGAFFSGRVNTPRWRERAETPASAQAAEETAPSPALSESRTCAASSKDRSRAA